MLVCIFGSLDGRHMQASFVSKCRRAHVWSLWVQWTIQNLSDVVTHRCEARKISLRQTVESHLQFQVRNHGGEVGVAGALTQSIQCSLNMANSRQHGSHGVSNRTTGVVVAVNSESCIVANK